MGMPYTEIENKTAKNIICIAAVIFLHLIVAYLLMASLTHQIIKPAEKPVELLIIQDTPPPPIVIPKPVDTPPEPPKVVEKPAETAKPLEKVPPVTKPVTKAVTPVAPTTTNVPAPNTNPAPQATPSPSPIPAAQATPSPAPSPAPVGVTRGVTKGQAGCKAPDYPRESLRNEEQGVVIVSVFVGTDGKVNESKVKKSSGSKNLDRAATKAFSLCSFQPAMKNGEAQPSWYDIPYEFVIN
ncbi:outer membrane transport energization protein TonB [Acinetobacter calcoaceticus]|uniref:Outer membrane transport energization protein TonB n=1 Tax=Acinetobacter calcoaceticus TaxID=471 RepID=A0A4R1Y2K9_ACICA|nr:outer membrane transport energization protein TonB [Acinetobacter calcoaceticus]